MTKRIVHKVEPGDDRNEIYATTYQMRNFYQQLGDGFFTYLDTMNYMQHHAIVKMIRKDERVLDMCCGRGLLLPMMRYITKDAESYTGVDIKASNAAYTHSRVTDGKPAPSDYYPFRVYFVEHDVATMSEVLPHDYFTFVAYTSSIEHMHPKVGAQSLVEARKVAQYGATLFLSCPVTPESGNGYDTQYAAHVYEWKRSEITHALTQSGWRLEKEFGLLIDRTELALQLKGDLRAAFESQSEILPKEWLYPVYAALFPGSSKEVAYIAKAV